ncbi:Ras-specific guanine nucleotide-releasing factor [Acrasis kona]|uniref:Ras-specific guanine nucleotide-releasing factor n=1 Tax=Acrasis kona TaxID=1008807 RepID=A0AAW2YTB0_9EUKA
MNQDDAKALLEVKSSVQDLIEADDNNVSNKKYWDLMSRIEVIEQKIIGIERRRRGTRFYHEGGRKNSVCRVVPEPDNHPTELDKRRFLAAKTIQSAYRRRKNLLLFKNTVQDFIKSPEAKVCRSRNNLIKEIETTERTYVECLLLVRNLYLIPLQSVKTDKERFGITNAELQILFINLEQLLRLHQIFFFNLKEEMGNWPVIQIGEVFLQQAPLFLFYITYINQFQKSTDLLREIKNREPNFVLFLNEQKKRPESNYLGLESLLITPVQRLPRYSLLLRELIKVTPEDHVDYDDLVYASERIALLNQTINAEKARFETVNVVERIVKPLNDQESERITELLIDKETKKPLRVFKGYESPMQLYINKNSKGISSDGYLFEELFLVVVKTEPSKTSEHVSFALDFNRKSSTDITLLPAGNIPQNSSLPRDAIHLIVSDNTTQESTSYTLHVVGKQADDIKKKLIKLINNSQNDKDAYRNSHNDEDQSTIVDRTVSEYRRIFEANLKVDSESLSIMDKYYPNDYMKKIRRKEEEKKSRQSLQSPKPADTDNMMSKFMKALLLDDANKSNNASNKKLNVDSPTNNSSQDIKLKENQTDNSKPKGYVSPYSESEGRKSSDTVKSEKPKNYVSPYETSADLPTVGSTSGAQKKEEANQSGSNIVNDLFGLLLNKKKDTSGDTKK